MSDDTRDQLAARADYASILAEAQVDELFGTMLGFMPDREWRLSLAALRRHEAALRRRYRALQHNRPDLLHQIEHAILAWTGRYPYSDKGYCYLCGEIDGHQDVHWSLGVDQSGHTEHAILPCPMGLLAMSID